jgi:SPP1 family phage portal protein
VNDKEQFVDRLLVLTGAILEEDEKGRKPMQQLREDHALQLPDSQSRAEYLTSEMNETDVEGLRRSLSEDIHKLSMVPDLSDANFASNASGVAMKYKLLGFEQLIRVKEQWFKEGLRARLKLFIHLLTLRGAEPLDVADVKIVFSHALPENTGEAAETVYRARQAGSASLETAVRMLHKGEDWTEEEVGKEVARIVAERE